MKDFDVSAHLSQALSGADETGFPPELLAEWEPQERLGGSALSETFLLRNRKDGSRAVAKLILPEQPEAFLSRRLGELSHPGLPKILNVWDRAGKVCILREYVEGVSLADSKAVYAAKDVVRIGLLLCDILNYLHTRTPPVIHRDVKPENIILRGDGTPVLIDFGIARLYSDAVQTDTRVMGTEHFAPPEQYGFRQTDARSDIYALGVTLRWMLTGSAVGVPQRPIGDKRLEGVLNRCTAFSPDERYADAAALKRALKKCERTRCFTWPAIAGICLALFALGLCLWADHSPKSVFSEPLIEQAVRQSLGVSENVPLTREMLAQVTGVYIVADEICADEGAFYESVEDRYAEGGDGYGPIASIEDLRCLPSLTKVMLCAENISDISPLKALDDLEKIELKHNQVEDVSPLAGKARLGSVGLNSNPVRDLSPLGTLPVLLYIDLCDASSYDPASMTGVGDLNMLDISNRTDSWRHLGARRISDLRINWSGLDDLKALENVTGLEKLSIGHSAVTSLKGIEVHGALKELNIAGCAITDLTPLEALPQLQTVVLSRDMEAAMDALGETTFDVIYE